MRDDLLGENINGNKARKLKGLDISGLESIVSHGSNQSNAMQAISYFARKNGLKFFYFTDHISSNLAKNPCGNYKFALENGTLMMKGKGEEALKFANQTPNSIFIKEGVCNDFAEVGFKEQAFEIEKFCDETKVKFDIFLPSGTGTSAAFLAKNLKKCKVFTCACVGDERYLKEQILSIDPNSKVEILKTPKKFHFGKPKMELYEIWQELKEKTGVTFDLIYDSVGWLTLLEHNFENQILYIHQGGLMGNESMILRYERLKNENFL